MKIKSFFIFVGSLVIALRLAAQTNPDDITGTWLTAGKEPAKNKRGQPVIGLVILKKGYIGISLLGRTEIWTR